MSRWLALWLMTGCAVSSDVRFGTPRPDPTRPTFTTEEQTQLRRLQAVAVADRLDVTLRSEQRCRTLRNLPQRQQRDEIRTSELHAPGIAGLVAASAALGAGGVGLLTMDCPNCRRTSDTVAVRSLGGAVTALSAVPIAVLVHYALATRDRRSVVVAPPARAIVRERDCGHSPVAGAFVELSIDGGNLRAPTDAAGHVWFTRPEGSPNRTARALLRAPGADQIAVEWPGVTAAEGKPAAELRSE